jgi:hypothetical protein
VVFRASVAALVIVGVFGGLGSLALGAFLASGNNGWSSSIIYSMVGLAGAPMAALSWSSLQSVRCQILAGVAVVLGLAANMGLLLNFAHEAPQIALAWSQVPAAVALWVLIWAGWGTAALARLVMFAPPRTRGRLSSRRGDAGL